MKTQALLTITTATLVAGTAFGDEYHIKSVDDLITFSNNVNKDTNYKGTTIFLDNDIDFSEAPNRFTPIGTEKNYFLGTFDGQGHTINNLKLNSTEKHTGLFGYSAGLAVKNFVMGASCSLENTYKSSDDSAYFAGIIGECVSKEGSCIIENSVNMGSAIFTGEITTSKRYSKGGGIYGRFSSENDAYDAIIRNCANYGTITYNGKSPSAYLGGIYGVCHGTSSHRCIVDNCLNAGRVVFNVTEGSRLYVGGIGGRVYRNNITNCVSIGMITIITEPGNTSKGALVGKINEGTTILTNCVWTEEDTGMNTSYGDMENGGQASPDELSNASSALNSETLAVLNKDRKKWILNSGRHTVQFFVNGALTMSANTALVQQPDMSGNDMSNFNGWYTDASCTSEFIRYETTGDLDLYGTYGVLQTITFILNDTVQVQSQQSIGEVIFYPDELFKTGYSFIGWNNTGNITKMPDYDITFVAQWVKGEPTDYVEIVFGRKDITSKEEVQRIIESFGDYTFTIEKFGTDEDSNPFVIIKFEDVKEAKSFVETVKAGSDSSIIRSVGFANEGFPKSLAYTTAPFSTLGFIIEMLFFML